MSENESMGQYSIDSQMTEITIKIPINQRENIYRRATDKKPITIASTRGADSFSFAGPFSDVKFRATINIWIAVPESGWNGTSEYKVASLLLGNGE